MLILLIPGIILLVLGFVLAGSIPHDGRWRVESIACVIALAFVTVFSACLIWTSGNGYPSESEHILKEGAVYQVQGLFSGQLGENLAVVKTATGKVFLITLSDKQKELEAGRPYVVVNDGEEEVLRLFEGSR